MLGPTLRQMEYLVAVAELGHFGQAAQRCGVSQPALSKQIQEVEQLWEVEIFERVRPRVRVTQAGLLLLERVRRVLAEAHELERSARALQGRPWVEVTLGVIPTLAPYLLPLLLPLLKEHAPQLRWRLYEAQTAVLFRKLHEGSVDLVLAAFPVEGDQFAGVDLYREPFVLATPPGAELSKLPRLRAQDLQGRPLLLMEEGHCLRDHALSWCRRVGAHEDPQIQTNSLNTMALMVRQGLGSTLLPASALGVESLPPQEIKVQPFSEGAPSRVVGLRWRPTCARCADFSALREPLLTLLPRLEARYPDGLPGPTPHLEPLPPGPRS